MKKPAGAPLSARTCLTSSRRSLREGKLTSYRQMVKYLLNIYGKDDIVVEADADIIIYKQPKDLNDIDYLQYLWTKALRCGAV